MYYMKLIHTYYPVLWSMTNISIRCRLDIFLSKKYIVNIRNEKNKFYLRTFQGKAEIGAKKTLAQLLTKKHEYPND